MGSVTLLPQRSTRTYAARLHSVRCGDGFEARVSGTLCGGVDLALLPVGAAGFTLCLDPTDALRLAEALRSGAADVLRNCLYDADPLLAAGPPT